MEKSNVIRICGEFPDGFLKPDIQSNPDFVFTLDPAYVPRKVWDIEGNYVFVNSFIECEHYVSGGWYFDPLKIAEDSYLLILFSAVVVFTLFKFISTKLLAKS